MIIDWTNFTPWTALAGGALIGLAAALLFLALGRIAGISGILGSLLEERSAEAGWRVAFLIGLLVAPGVWATVSPGGLPLPAHTVDSPRSWAILTVAGLLVGFGTGVPAGTACAGWPGSQRALWSLSCVSWAVAWRPFSLRGI